MPCTPNRVATASRRGSMSSTNARTISGCKNRTYGVVIRASVNRSRECGCSQSGQSEPAPGRSVVLLTPAAEAAEPYPLIFPVFIPLLYHATESALHLHQGASCRTSCAISPFVLVRLRHKLQKPSNDAAFER